MKMKESTVTNTVKRLERRLNRVINGIGGPSALDTVSQCSRKIEWLWKFRYISEREMNRLADLSIEANKIIEQCY